MSSLKEVDRQLIAKTKTSKQNKNKNMLSPQKTNKQKNKGKENKIIKKGVNGSKDERVAANTKQA